MARIQLTPGIDIAVAVLGLQLKIRCPILKRNNHGLLATHEQGSGKVFEIWISH